MRARSVILAEKIAKLYPADYVAPSQGAPYSEWVEARVMAREEQIRTLTAMLEKFAKLQHIEP